MTKVHEQHRLSIIKKIIEHVKLKVSAKQAELLDVFVQRYYANVGIEDLEERSIRNLAGAAMSHWKLLQKRKPQEFKIRVFNPHYERDGWQSTHTIIQMVHDDMPFIVDSTRMELNRMGITTHLIIHLGGLKVKRDKNTEIKGIFPHRSTEPNLISEAPIAMEIDRQSDMAVLESIQENLSRILHDVQMAVIDWLPMRERIYDTIKGMDKHKPPTDDSEIEESKAFLKWLADEHFTFLGSREYKIEGEDNEKLLRLIPKSGLGVLREAHTAKVSRYLSELPAEARKLALSKQILIISKTNTRSTVHRPTYTDYIGVKHFNDKGDVVGETRFIGLYTSDAYHSNPMTIPMLRLKVEHVIEKTGWARRSHSAKALLNILETLPRDDLFQASRENLFELGMGIMQIQERRKIRLFVYKDAYGRYISCLVYIPRDNFNTELLLRMKEVLRQAFLGTEVSFTTHFSESVLARVHYVIRIDTKNPPKYDVRQIEKQLIEVGRSWQDALLENLVEYFGEERGNGLAGRYRWAFAPGYRDAFTAKSAVYDIEHIEKLTSANDLEMSFYRPLGAAGSILRFKLFRPSHTVPLSDALPMLENMGLRVIGEQPYEITFQDGSCVWINDFNMVYVRNVDLNVEEVRDIFQQAFYKIWRGEAESDGFNRLVIGANLNWREISVLRGYARYLRQIGFTFSQQYMESTLAQNPNVARLLIELFHLRFDPNSKQSKTKLKTLERHIQKELDSVVSLDEDRMLRRYLNVIKSTIRTNYYQVDEHGQVKSYISFKFNPEKIIGMPLPRPKYEVFVYSPRFEGVHLRAAKVARGGIRWSDRREDFRTEILGLMKAQQVKNAVIVPYGAKGGFVVKQPPAEGTREAIMEEGIYCYQHFIRGLLDLADNYVDGQVVCPDNTTRYDDEDPYLVVAADKGTATFSDIANNIAQEYQFWLHDAFASGGSSGYDHKKMGITARGAWESVKNHFIELGIDVQKQSVSVVGIGDMSGDVFGNGMLCSHYLKLVGAFNHMHIFVDPNPDPKISFKERMRLFNLPRSTWEDYNSELISKGGGVFRRSAKAIKISPQMRKLLDVNKTTMVPNELIQALLRAPVDLLWNGGIGTYVKACTESHSDTGDRANDVVRVNGNQLRVKVVGEGGNLGFTQLARIEYDLNGGLVNTDFIDNSGGVDCSDHEVNIKILLNRIVDEADMTMKHRNELLTAMTDDVTRLVLRNNYRQTHVIGFARKLSPDNMNLYTRFMTEQERLGNINRELEFLPSAQIITERKASGQGLTRPEIAVLQAYSKLIHKQEILASDLVDDTKLARYIESAFPEILVKRYQKQIHHHQLRREILATQLSNMIITDMGVTFVHQMKDEANASTPAIVKAYLVAREIYQLDIFWTDIRSLDHQVEPSVQDMMRQDVTRMTRRATRWLLRTWGLDIDVHAAAEHFSERMQQLASVSLRVMIGAEKEHYRKQRQYYIDHGVPDEIASKFSLARLMYSALNCIEAATYYKADLVEVASIYYQISDRLDLVWFREHINSYPVDTHWSVLARAAIKGDLDWQQRALTVGVLNIKDKSLNIKARIERWLQLHQLYVDRWQTILAELRSTDTLEFTMLSVAMRELMELSQASLRV